MTVIAFCNLKGGVGKSTTAIALADFLHRQGQSVVLVDTDAQQSTAQWAAYLGLAYRSFTYADILTELDYLKADYDYVIVDAPSVLLEVSLNIMERADRLFVPTKTSVLDLNSTGDILNEIQQVQRRRNGLPDVSVFLSMGRRNALSVGESKAYLAASYPEFRLSEAVIYDRACIGDGFGQQTTVWGMTKTKAVKDAIADYTNLFSTALGLPHAIQEKTARRRLRATKPPQTRPAGKTYASAS